MVTLSNTDRQPWAYFEGGVAIPIIDIDEDRLLAVVGLHIRQEIPDLIDRKP